MSVCWSGCINWEGGGAEYQLCSKLVNIFRPVSASFKVVRPGRGVV